MEFEGGGVSVGKGWHVQKAVPIVDGGSRIAGFKQVLWIRIRTDSQVSAGSPGSGSILAMRIRIHEQGNLPKFINRS